MELSLDEQYAFETVIDATICARYDGPLERHEDVRGKRGDTYTALDASRVQELLTELWGSHLTADAIANAVCRLTEDKLFGTWPKAWCDDEEDEEKALRAARETDWLAENL